MADETTTPKDLSALDRLSNIDRERKDLTTQLVAERKQTLEILRRQCAVLGFLDRDKLEGILKGRKSRVQKVAKAAPVSAPKKVKKAEAVADAVVEPGEISKA